MEVAIVNETQPEEDTKEQEIQPEPTIDWKIINDGTYFVRCSEENESTQLFQEIRTSK